MIPSFKIEREGTKKYYIKRKTWLLCPFFELRIMTKDEFMPDLTQYGNYVYSKEYATFVSIDHAYEALHQYAALNGHNEIIVKISDY